MRLNLYHSVSRQCSASRPTALRLLFAVGLLRVLVPVGFMPAPLTDGWFVQLCPDGMPSQVMAALLGGEHHHHHHAGTDQDRTAVPAQCELGAGLAAAMVPPGCLAAAPSVAGAPIKVTQVPAMTGLPFVAHFRSRAPPGHPVSA